MNRRTNQSVARLLAAVALLSASPLMAAEPLEITDVGASYTDLGPRRQDRTYFPGDNICFRWHLSGDGPTATGGVDLDFTIRLLDAEQKSLFVNTVRRRTSNWKAGKSFYSVWTKIPDHFAPGLYTFECELEDKANSRTATLSEQFEVKPLELAIVRLRFSYDKNGLVRAPAGGFAGQHWFLGGSLIGEDRSQGKIEVDLEYRLLEQESALQVAAARNTIQMNDPLVIRDRARNPNFQISIPLERAGKFMFRLIATDKVSGRSTQLDIPLLIASPLDEPENAAAPGQL